MTAPIIVSKEEALERVLGELCRAADATIANKRGALLAAADPAKRANMEEAHRTFARWIPALRRAYRKLDAADAVVAKALRKVRPGVRA